MANTPFCDRTADKLYLLSGVFTSTVKSSLGVNPPDFGPEGISWDGLNTSWCGSQTRKLFYQSGQINSTVKSSVDVNAVDTNMQSISADGTNTPWLGSQGFKQYLQSGMMTSTIKTSQSINSVDSLPTGISYSSDGVTVETPWTGETANKLYLTSGQFTSTIKTSEDLSAVDSEVKDVSYDGTDSPWIGGFNGGQKMYLQSGQFTSTIKTSLASIQVEPTGICTSEFDARTGVLPSSGDVAVTFPIISVLSLGGPGVVSITLPIMTVSATSSGGYIQLPIFTVLATGNPDPFATLGMFSETLPMLSLASQSGFGNHVIITLPSPTVEVSHFIRGNVSITLPRLTFNTVVQQGVVHDMELSLPAFTLSAFSGHPVSNALPQFTIDAQGSNGYVGTFIKNLPRMIVNVKATQGEIVTGNIILPQFSFNLSGLQGIVSTSVGNRTLPIFQINAHAYRGENGNVAITLPMPSLTIVGVLDPDGTFSNSLFMLTLDAYADVYTNRII